MKRISEKLDRQERIRGYLIQDMSHKEIMNKENISNPTLWRDITQIGKSDNKPMKRPAYVFATRSHIYLAERGRILKSIFSLQEKLQGADLENQLKIESELTKKERALVVVDKAFDDWLFRSGVVKEIPAEQKVQVSFADFKKLKNFEEEQSGESKDKVPATQVPRKISLVFSKD